MRFYTVTAIALLTALFTSQAYAVPDSVVDQRNRWGQPVYFDDYVSPVSGETETEYDNNNQYAETTAVAPQPTVKQVSPYLTPKTATKSNEASQPVKQTKAEDTANKRAEEERLHPKHFFEAKNWSGSIDGGLSYATGNTEEEEYNASLKLKFEGYKFVNTFEASLRNESADDTTTAEEYRIKDQLNYKLTEKDYIFGSLQYVDDRFSGYEYRLTENLGYGRNFVKSDDFTWSGEVSAGFRHSELEGQDREDEAITRLGTNVDWTITETLSNTHDLDVTFGEESTITEYEFGLKADIYKSLYLKLGFMLENISEVPAGTEKTDTLTTLNVGYSF